MRDLIAYKNLLAMAALLLLAGCASTPAPVVNHSFGSGQPAPTPAPTTPTSKAHASGAQTFGLGHANGTTTSAGYVVAPGDTLYSVAFAHGMDVRTLAAQNQIPPPYTIHPGQVLQLKATASTPAVAAAPASQPVATKPTKPTEPVFGPVTAQSMTANGVAATSAAAASTSSVATAPPSMPPVPATTAPVVSGPPRIAATPAAGATRNVAGIGWRWPAAGKIVGGFSAGAGGDGAGLDIAGQVGDPVRAAASGTVVYSGNGLIGYGELIIVKHNDAYLSAYGHNSKRLVKEGQHVDAGQEIALMGASGAPRVELHFEIRKNGKPVDPAAYLPAR